MLVRTVILYVAMTVCAVAFHEHTYAVWELRELMIERQLLPTSATLVVVPDALLEHWCEQLRRHLNLRYFGDEHDTTGRGVVSEGGGLFRGGTQCGAKVASQCGAKTRWHP